MKTFDVPSLSYLHHRKNYYLLKMYNLYNVENGSNRLAPNRSVKQEMKICFADVFLAHCYKMTRVTTSTSNLFLCAADFSLRHKSMLLVR